LQLSQNHDVPSTYRGGFDLQRPATTKSRFLRTDALSALIQRNLVTNVFLSIPTNGCDKTRDCLRNVLVVARRDRDRWFILVACLSLLLIILLEQKEAKTTPVLG
jgi:hypothetical protein